MKLLCSIALACLVLTSLAQDETNAPEPGAIYLWVRNYSTLTNKLAQLDAAMGYPNPATLTWRTIDFDMLTNGTNAVVRVDLNGVWSPRLNRTIDLAEKIREQLTAAQWGTDVVTNLTDLQGKAVARINGSLARQIGNFLTRTNTTTLASQQIK